MICFSYFAKWCWVIFPLPTAVGWSVQNPGSGQHTSSSSQNVQRKKNETRVPFTAQIVPYFCSWADFGLKVCQKTSKYLVQKNLLPKWFQTLRYFAQEVISKFIQTPNQWLEATWSCACSFTGSWFTSNGKTEAFTKGVGGTWGVGISMRFFTYPWFCEPISVNGYGCL